MGSKQNDTKSPFCELNCKISLNLLALGKFTSPPRIEDANNSEMFSLGVGGHRATFHLLPTAHRPSSANYMVARAARGSPGGNKSDGLALQSEPILLGQWRDVARVTGWSPLGHFEETRSRRRGTFIRRNRRRGKESRLLYLRTSAGPKNATARRSAPTQLRSAVRVLSNAFGTARKISIYAEGQE